MSSKADLDFLEQKLSAATGPDRELDARIFAELCRPSASAPLFWDALPTGAHPIELYTGSLDAAIALVERMLPNWFWDVRGLSDWIEQGQWHYEAEIWLPVTKAPRELNGNSRGTKCKTAALALCLALVRSLQKEDGNS